MMLADHYSVRPFLRRPVILDANLLLLLWCIQFAPDLLYRFKRLQINSRPFEQADFDLLTELLVVFPEVRTTTHILTEVSNLANALPEWKKLDWSAWFADRIGQFTEIWKSSAQIAEDREAMAFGLTDAALVSFAETAVVVTVDRRLAGYLASRSLAVINFNHLRQERLLT